MRFYLSAIGCLLLGLFFRFCLRGYSFTALLLFCGCGVLLSFGLLESLSKRLPRLCKLLRRCLCVFLCLILLAALPTGILIGVKCAGAAEAGCDYVIVLGAGVNGTQPSRSLRERLVRTEAYLRQYPEAIAVLSGGKGGGEQISEAECMYRWLTEAGIPPQRLRREDQATNTEENLRYSLALIREETGTVPEKVAVISSEYHLARAELLAKNAGVPMLPCPAETGNKLYFSNMFLREIAAIWGTLFRLYLL